MRRIFGLACIATAVVLAFLGMSLATPVGVWGTPRPLRVSPVVVERVVVVTATPTVVPTIDPFLVTTPTPMAAVPWTPTPTPQACAYARQGDLCRLVTPPAATLPSPPI